MNTFLLLLAGFIFESAAPVKTTGTLPVPAGYTRLPAAPGSFGEWLRTVPLKSNNTVYLYDGRPKANQQAQYAVLDVTVGKKDLQQCADAVIRLYAEYLYSGRQYTKIAFHATDGTLMDYNSWRKGYRFVVRQHRLQKMKTAAPSDARESFDQYLQVVFSYAGTLSLQRELKPVSQAAEVAPGDVFIQGGSPGHAVIVMDVIQNAKGERQFLLAQSYMPAQDIHILRNPSGNSPWYNTTFGNQLYTPEWTFGKNSLHRWP